MSSFKPGEIYLVREFDFTSKKESRYTKIGLVHAPRKSIDRLKEHQTGNPNILRLIDSEVVQTEAVDWVEAMLHRIYAKHRVSGEWFELNPAQRKDVLHEAEKLREEAKALPKLQKKVDLLTSTKDNSKTVKPNPEQLALASQLLIAKMQLKAIGPLQIEINRLFKKAVESGVDIAGAAKVQTKTYAAKMLKDDQKALLKDFPEIYKKFEELKSEFYQRFSLVFEDATLVLSAEFEAEIESIGKLIEQVSESFDPYVANEANLMLSDLKTVAERQVIFSDLALREACGKNQAIEGVCTWPRHDVERVFFNVDKFVAKHKDLAEKYMKASWTETYVNAVKRKAQ